MTLDTQKLHGLFTRVVNNKMEENDHADIVAFAKKVFGDGSVNPDPSLLHQFNNLVVKQADLVAQPILSDIVGLLANYQVAQRDQVVRYEIPRKIKAKVRWSANGSGVDLVRVENKKAEIAVPRTFSTGFYYEPFGMITDTVATIQRLVEDIANAKVRLYLTEINKLITAAITSTEIPAANVLAGDNLTLASFNKKSSIIQRVAGGRPVFIADSLMIDYFAMQQTISPATGSVSYKETLTDGPKEELRRALNITQIGRTDAVNLINPFTDETNSATEYPVNVGYIIGGSASQKPFVVTEFGGLRQLTEQDIEDERIKLKLVQEADIQLLFGEAIVRITENTAVSL